MSSDRSLFWMQVFTLVPAISFLFIYTHGLTYTIMASLLLALLVYNVYLQIRKKSLVQYPLLGLLIASFFLYAFYGLGSQTSPQTFEVLKEGQGVTRFDFQKPTNIDKICYYVGIDKNVNFTLEYMPHDRWQKFYSYENSYPYSFSWRCINQKVKTSKILLRLLNNEMMLHEVRFSYRGKELPYVSNKKYLNDEPQMSVDTSYYGSMFFDEIYFGRTAYEILHELSVYENTHPYLGKVLIGLGIKLFGMTPFGWRFMDVIFASLLIFMVYYFAWHLFRKKEYGFVAAFLMTYSFMHLSQARIAVVDTFGVLFVLISYFFLYRFFLKQELSRLIVSGVFFGLAASVKWSAVFAALGFVFISAYILLSRYPLIKRFSGYRLLLYGLLSYGVIAFVVYGLSFYALYAQTGSLQSIIAYNTNMYHYHSTLQATHPYSSAWWSWLLDMKPMGYYKEVKYGLVSSINVFGNPAIFWMGIIALVYAGITLIKRAALETVFVLLAFLGLYLPYIFVGRLMFIYHVYYALPFLILLIVLMLKDGIEKSQWVRKFYGVYLGVVSGLFIAFYPVLSGYVVPQSYVARWLTWFSTWWF